jgi:hypothetical protein
MKRKIKRLPANAVYEYRNGFGEEVYYTNRRVYTVKSKRNFGKIVKIIYSYTKQEYYND